MGQRSFGDTLMRDADGENASGNWNDLCMQLDLDQWRLFNKCSLTWGPHCDISNPASCKHLIPVSRGSLLCGLGSRNLGKIRRVRIDTYGM
jgi:hypothetical protein